mmetsp:Transcript_4044/g.8175  ORF Transcript_4044/g.8175 Transcript_4044/m.8175 type:complete len:81 (+) Transcript_4044:70-312(+)
MDSAVKRGLGHPYERQVFNPLETDAGMTHADPFLIIVALILIALWWKMSFGTGNWFASRAGQGGIEMREGAYGSAGYYRI